MLYPVQRRTGMRATVSIGKKPPIVVNHKALDDFAVEINLKTAGSRIRQMVGRTDYA
jgi:hypothetical protein